MARRVLLAYNKKDDKLAKKLLKQLGSSYPKTEKKIYDLMSAGYFDEMMLPFIKVFKSETGKEYKENYRKFFEDVLEFFPIAIFVGNKTTKEILRQDIKKRLRLKGVPFVRIHAIGQSNIEKVMEVIKELGIDDKFRAKDFRYNAPPGIKAQIYEIRFR
jgi:hypothetical protein